MLPESAAGSTSIMVSSFPSPSELESWKDEGAEKDMEVYKTVDYSSAVFSGPSCQISLTRLFFVPG